MLLGRGGGATNLPGFVAELDAQYRQGSNDCRHGLQRVTEHHRFVLQVVLTGEASLVNDPITGHTAAVDIQTDGWQRGEMGGGREGGREGNWYGEKGRGN